MLTSTQGESTGLLLWPLLDPILWYVYAYVQTTQPTPGASTEIQGVYVHTQIFYTGNAQYDINRGVSALLTVKQIYFSLYIKKKKPQSLSSLTRSFLVCLQQTDVSLCVPGRPLMEGGGMSPSLLLSLLVAGEGHGDGVLQRQRRQLFQELGEDDGAVNGVLHPQCLSLLLQPSGPAPEQGAVQRLAAVSHVSQGKLSGVARPRGAVCVAEDEVA